MHMHKVKDETFYVTRGRMLFEIRGPRGDVVSQGFSQAQDGIWSFAWDVPPGQPGGEKPLPDITSLKGVKIGSVFIPWGGTGTLNLAGSYNQTNGTFQNTSGTLTVNFTGASKTFTQSSGTLDTANMNFSVNFCCFFCQ